MVILWCIRVFFALLRSIFLCSPLCCAYHCGALLHSIVGRSSALLRSVVGCQCLVLLILQAPVPFHSHGLV